MGITDSQAGLGAEVSEDEVRVIERLHAQYEAARQQLAGVIVGLDEAIEQLFIAMLCRGHCMFEGVPGLAKTMLIATLGKVMDLSLHRIQFTPDLMPADITGTEVLQEDRSTGERVFRFTPGPLFANLILADEINRTPPKTQAALLEAMQERQLTVAGQTHELPEPFFVLATQNPIEQEGTYPLPEAQLDRFLFKIKVGYPTAADEIAIAKRATTSYRFEPAKVIDGQALQRMQAVVRRIPVSEQVYEKAIALAQLTRPSQVDPPHPAAGYVREMVAWGAGPRASINLLLAAKARAVIRGRFHATLEDVARAALPVLRHRVILTFNAQAAGRSSDEVIRNLLRAL